MQWRLEMNYPTPDWRKFGAFWSFALMLFLGLPQAGSVAMLHIASRRDKRRSLPSPSPFEDIADKPHRTEVLSPEASLLSMEQGQPGWKYFKKDIAADLRAAAALNTKRNWLNNTAHIMTYLSAHYQDQWDAADDRSLVLITIFQNRARAALQRNASNTTLNQVYAEVQTWVSWYQYLGRHFTSLDTFWRQIPNRNNATNEVPLSDWVEQFHRFGYASAGPCGDLPEEPIHVGPSFTVSPNLTEFAASIANLADTDNNQLISSTEAYDFTHAMDWFASAGLPTRGLPWTCAPFGGEMDMWMSAIINSTDAIMLPTLPGWTTCAIGDVACLRGYGYRGKANSTNGANGTNGSMQVISNDALTTYKLPPFLENLTRFYYAQEIGMNASDDSDLLPEFKKG